MEGDAGMIHEAEQVLAGVVYNMYSIVPDKVVNMRLFGYLQGRETHSK